MQDHSLLSMAGKVMTNVPLAGEVGRTMEAAGGAIAARNATSQLECLVSTPPGCLTGSVGMVDADDPGKRNLTAQLSSMNPVPRGRLTDALLRR